MRTPSPATKAPHRQLAAAHDHGVTHLAVAAVITDHDQHTLLLLHNPGDAFTSYWDLPTGPVHADETILDALDHTVTTAGLTIDRITSYLGHHDTRGDNGLTRTFLFAVTPTNPHRICANTGHHWAAPPPRPDPANADPWPTADQAAPSPPPDPPPTPTARNTPPRAPAPAAATPTKPASNCSSTTPRS